MNIKSEYKEDPLREEESTSMQVYPLEAVELFSSEEEAREFASNIRKMLVVKPVDDKFCLVDYFSGYPLLKD